MRKPNPNCPACNGNGIIHLPRGNSTLCDCDVEEQIPPKKSAIAKMIDEQKARSMGDIPLIRYADAMQEVQDELLRAVNAWGPYNSAHEAKGILDEEVFEFTQIVFMKQKNRDLVKMRGELIQVACVAVRAAAEICSEERGRR